MPRTTAVSAPSKAPVSLVLDEKRFSNMAKRLAEHLGERHSVKLGHTHARTALAKALNFDSPNELQALLKDTDAGKNSESPVLAGWFDEELLGEAARDLLKATRETEQHGALAEELMKLLNAEVLDRIVQENPDDFNFVTTRFVVDPNYASDMDIPDVLLLQDKAPRWSNLYDDHDGNPIDGDGLPIPGFRVDLPNGHLVRWVLETLIGTRAFFNWQHCGYRGLTVDPDPIFNTVCINGSSFQVQVTDADELDLLTFRFYPKHDSKELHPLVAEGAVRLFGGAAVLVAREGIGTVSRVDEKGTVHTMDANQAKQLLNDYAHIYDLDPRQQQSIKGLLPFRERTIFLDVMRAR